MGATQVEIEQLRKLVEHAYREGWRHGHDARGDDDEDVAWMLSEARFTLDNAQEESDGTAV